jgi:hypothetical protein
MSGSHPVVAFGTGFDEHLDSATREIVFGVGVR